VSLSSLFSAADEAIASSFLSDVAGQGSVSELYPAVSEGFEFDFERSGATKQQLKALIAQVR
jgi:hypothetical protein